MSRRETVIAVDNLSFAYPIYPKPSDLVLETLTRRKRHDLFWALRDVSFEVRSKQRVGIIGPNGSGKSTLLRLVTGNLQPTTGGIRIAGQISALLSLNSVLQPEESGLKNIRFNLMLNGCQGSEIERLTEDVIDFAELGPFIYAPVRTYSSGMHARLSFAISTAIAPEILVVDEVLAVGDGYFVSKAMKRMYDLVDRGKALLFVSHSIAAMQSMCDTVLWMDNGSIRRFGPAGDVLREYEDGFNRQQNETLRANNVARRSALESSQSLSQADGPDRYRLRLVSRDHAAGFADTHYIRRITLHDPATKTKLDVPLTLHDIRGEILPAAIDAVESEWGRFYHKDGHDSRILTHQSAKGRGGQIVVCKTSSTADDWNVRLEVEYCSHRGQERLAIEVADYNSGRWQRINDRQMVEAQIGGAWKLLTADLAIPVIQPESFPAIAGRIEEVVRPDVEIVGVNLIADGTEVQSIDEHQPFEVRVEIVAHRSTPIVDVGIKLMRADGVYVFWQSSGLAGHNLHDVEGKRIVCFCFEQNYLAAGDYYISCFCGNGWFGLDNFPHSQIFDQRESLAQFVVRREFEPVAFGQLNMRVPVKLIA